MIYNFLEPNYTSKYNTKTILIEKTIISYVSFCFFGCPLHRWAVVVVIDFVEHRTDDDDDDDHHFDDEQIGLI